jgi:hypothetical protein
MKKNSRNKNRREQAAKFAKGENKGWRDARLQHSNMNLTVPSGKVYKRPAPGKRWE